MSYRPQKVRSSIFYITVITWRFALSVSESWEIALHTQHRVILEIRCIKRLTELWGWKINDKTKHQRTAKAGSKGQPRPGCLLGVTSRNLSLDRVCGGAFVAFLLKLSGLFYRYLHKKSNTRSMCSCYIDKKSRILLSSCLQYQLESLCFTVTHHK